MNLQKTPRWESKKYRDWVKKQDCMVCDRPADDPHHIANIGHMSGIGITAPDWAIMPLCRECHGKMHKVPEWWSGQWEMIARTLGKAIEEGLL